MSKGLKLTLATVAFAILGFNAMATAPVISGIPDIIVGDAEAPGTFVYPDAVNLTEKVSDDVTPLDEILWSFFSAGPYSLNGAASNAGDLVNPAAGALVAGPGGDYTVTYANTGTPAGSGVVDAAAIAYYASDGTTVSAPFMAMVYTEIDGVDATSGGSTGIPVDNFDFTVSSAGWTFVTVIGTNLTNSTAGGLKMGCTLAGDAFGQWESGMYTLVDGQIYEAIADVSVTLNAGEKPPVLDWLVVNPLFTFWADMYFTPRPDLGANSSTVLGIYHATQNPSGIQQQRIYWTPACVNSPDWQAALANATEAAKATFKFQWRLTDLDLTGLPVFGALAGTVAMTKLDITRYDEAAAVAVVSNVMNPQASTLTAVGDATGAASGTSLLVTINNFGAAGFQQVGVGPGDGSYNVASYPVTWTSNQILRLSAGLRAPTAADAANPPHVIRLFFQQAGFEMSSENNVAANRDASSIGSGSMPSMPKTTSSEYVNYTYTHNASVSADVTGTGLAGSQLRPYVQIFSLNTLGISFGAASGGTTGDIQVDSFSVDVVSVD